jgi:hypothetical protein
MFYPNYLQCFQDAAFYNLVPDERVFTNFTQIKGIGKSIAQRFVEALNGEFKGESENYQHYAVFTIELLLDDENAVRRLRFMHVQCQEEFSCAWQSHRGTVPLLRPEPLEIYRFHPLNPGLKAIFVNGHFFLFARPFLLSREKVHAQTAFSTAVDC